MAEMNLLIHDKVRNPNCEGCKLCHHTDFVCETGMGAAPAKIMVVGKMPNSDYYQDDLEQELEEVGLKVDELYYASALKCRTFDADASNSDVKHCRGYLEQEIEIVKPSWILALGNEALLATTGHSGIMKYRGRTVERDGHKVFPTISPASVLRNPGQRPGWTADLLLFTSLVSGMKPMPAPPIFVVDTKAKMVKLTELLGGAELMAYDVETVGDHESTPDARIVSLSGTLVMRSSGRVIVWALPLYHPDSPWLKTWRGVLKYLAPHLEQVPKQVAHNGKYDARWLRAHGVNVKVTFDTILACHLLDENRQKGLKPQAASRLGVPPWSIDTKSLLTTPLRTVLKYNALDTFYDYHIYLQIKEELKAKPRLLRIFTKILMPANEILIESERRGIYVDLERLAERGKIARDMRDEIDRQLMQWVPDPEKVDGWPTKGRRGKFAEVNFNPSNFSRWLLFDHLKLPILARGKDKQDGSPGMPSMAEKIMLELRTEHPIVNILLERTKWQKYVSAFFSAYDELVDENHRIHTTFKLFGTVTGRLSSGKEDSEKITARIPTRGVNLQQVPRDEFVRGLFGSAPGFTFVEVDFSQIELRIAAFLSRDRTMMRLYQTNQDIHMATAVWVMGKPASQISKEDRKKAKAINFGFIYGMGAPKFVSTAFEKYELRFTLDEAKAIRKEFFGRFKGLFPWHARMRRLANEHARVQSPIGRIRHLPDVRSSDSGVVAEAERQAINSPVQSFASDMNLLGMIETVKMFKAEGIEGYVVGTVHDATLFEVKDEDRDRALPLIKQCYENLPLRKKFGVVMDVPIVADLKTGRWWGGGEEWVSVT